MSSRSSKTCSRKAKGRPNATYWHGGVPGLTVGAVLLPAGGGKLPSQSMRGASIGARTVPGKVFFTSDKVLARAYAQTLRAGGKTGTLYQVRPRGAVQRDPDYGPPCPAVSFMADSARIVAVVEANVLGLSHEEVGRAFGRYQYWSADDPYCAPDGAVRTGPGLRQEGWTDEAFALLPRWTLREDLYKELSNLLTRSPGKVLALAPGIAAHLIPLAGYLSAPAIHALKNAAHSVKNAAPPAVIPDGSSWVRRLFRSRRGRS